MNLITKDTDYAIRAVCFIAKNKGGIVSVRALVKDMNIPRPFLRGILQKLNKNRILKSYKGKGGGFKLAGPADKIFITDLIKIFQGPVKLQEHFFRKCVCPEAKTCYLKKKLDHIEKMIRSELKSINIAVMIREGSK